MLIFFTLHFPMSTFYPVTCMSKAKRFPLHPVTCLFIEKGFPLPFYRTLHLNGKFLSTKISWDFDANLEISDSN